MSRQFDDSRENIVDVYGEDVELVEPSNFDELSEAYKTLNKLENYYGGLMHDDDNQNSALASVEQQKEYIQDFIDSLGEFDNTILINNISYMAKSHNMMIKDIEQTLGLSAGYISRTSSENAKKKLSIDVVWKISKLFDVALGDLIESDLSEDNSNKTLICKFIDKLTKQTLNYEIAWDEAGGYCSDIDEEIYFTNYFEETELLQYRYKKHKDSLICRQILVSGGFDGDTLVLVPYINAKTKMENYDFYFLTQGNPYDYNDLSLQKIFYTIDDETGSMQNCVKKLLRAIDKIKSDAFLGTNMRSYLEKYVKGGTNDN